MNRSGQKTAEGILFTDEYQLTMAQLYYRMGFHEKEVLFDHFFRNYPDYGIPAVRSVASGRCDRAILACTNGIGMSILANRIPGIRGALVYSERTAAVTRQHHDSNVLCLGAGEFGEEELLKMVRTWLDTEFEGGRHVRRVRKLQDLEP